MQCCNFLQNAMYILPAQHWISQDMKFWSMTLHCSNVGEPHFKCDRLFSLEMLEIYMAIYFFKLLPFSWKGRKIVRWFSCGTGGITLALRENNIAIQKPPGVCQDLKLLLGFLLWIQRGWTLVLSRTQRRHEGREENEEPHVPTPWSQLACKPANHSESESTDNCGLRHSPLSDTLLQALTLGSLSQPKRWLTRTV